MKRCLSDQISLGHTAAQLANMTQKPNEPLRLYIYRYSKLHKAVTQKDACHNTDPSRWFRFLTSITNTSITDKVTRSKTLPHNLQQCFEKALEYEASFQLSEGVNMARKMPIMNVNVEEEDEVNFVKDTRARSNACFKCGEMGHFQWDSQVQGQTALDSHDPVVGKWMTNLVATTPITAKAMQSLVAELNRQKELKRTYRRRYKDLQTVTTTTANPVMSQPPVVAMSNKMSASPSILKTSLGQGKKINRKGKNTNPVDKGKKCVVISTPGPVTSTSAGPSSNLRNKPCDKAKVTAAMIQELTEELQSIDQESMNDE